MQIGMKIKSLWYNIWFSAQNNGYLRADKHGIQHKIEINENKQKSVKYLGMEGISEDGRVF